MNKQLMPDVSFKIISIGAFDAHPLWNEREPVRSAHATTTVIESAGAKILVDPSLPAQILEARLAERANLKVDQITHVFLTSFEPMRRRALGAFDKAKWLISEGEREAIGVSLIGTLREAMEGGDAELTTMLRAEVELLEQCAAAPDRLVDGVDLFPLNGVTPGTCGLLLPTSRATVLLCGDAVASAEHLDEGKVLPTCADIEQAQQSFSEAIEIADLMVLGRDNVVMNPLRRAI